MGEFEMVDMRQVYFQVGSVVVVADVDAEGGEPWDGRHYAVEVDSEPHGGGMTKSQAIAYATTRHNENLVERLIDAASALRAESGLTTTRLEAALASLKRHPLTGE